MGYPPLLISVLAFLAVGISAVFVVLMPIRRNVVSFLPIGPHPFPRPLRRLLDVDGSGMEIGINSAHLLAPRQCPLARRRRPRTSPPPAPTSRAGSCPGCGHLRGYIRSRWSTLARRTMSRTMRPRDASSGMLSVPMPRPSAQWRRRGQHQPRRTRAPLHLPRPTYPRRLQGQALQLRHPLRQRTEPFLGSGSLLRWPPTARGTEKLEGGVPRLGRSSLEPRRMLQFEGPPTGLGRNGMTVTDSAPPSGDSTYATGT